MNKILVLIASILLLGGCASPFRTVYTSPDDYYLVEQSSDRVYYEFNSVIYADVGFYPWWVTAYNPLQFVYYSPYFYPHYFSIWYPPSYSPYYGYYTGYWSYWCPPYPVRRLHRWRDTDEVDLPNPEPAVTDGRYLVSRQDLWRAADNQSLNRRAKMPGAYGYKSYNPAKSMSTFRSAPAKPSYSFPAADFGQRPGMSGSSRAANSGTRSVGIRASGVAPARSKD